MNMSEKFSLKWNDFHSNVSKTFSALRTEEDFQDVTLVSAETLEWKSFHLRLNFSDMFIG